MLVVKQSMVIMKHMELKMYNVFITGCDKNTEWMIPWWYSHIRKTGVSLLIYDFGMTESMLEWASLPKDINIGPRLNNGKAAWFNKPDAIKHAIGIFDKVVWVDTDCQVFPGAEDIFDKLVDNKLNMVVDRPWSARDGSTWYNSGVVGVTTHNLDILNKWIEICKPKYQHRGDQEALHHYLGNDPLSGLVHINELPNEYNWLRLQGEPASPVKIRHHTGQKGKALIKSMMEYDRQKKS